MSIERIGGVRGVGPEIAAGRLQGSGHGAEVVSVREHLGQEPQVYCEVTREEIEQATQDLNRMLQHINQRLSFRIHEGSERMIVYVIDNKTNEVVRELPPEKFLDTIAKIREFIGILFDAWF